MEKSIDVFLLIGQSNMAGRGLLGEVVVLADPQVLMFRNDSWQRAEEPLHTDKPAIAGVGLGSGFALELLGQACVTPIGLVPCAVGGTPLSRWMPGMDLYEAAVSIAKRALSSGTLKGILWHQGESDSNDAETANSYGARFEEMITRLRAELGAGEVPVVAGELGMFLAEEEKPRCYFNTINRHLRELEEVLPAYGFVSSSGLTDKGDKVHFDSRSLREFGARYAQRFLELAEDDR